MYEDRTHNYDPKIHEEYLSYMISLSPAYMENVLTIA